MLTSGHLTDLARHMAWADAVAWQAVLRSPAGAADERIRFWLHHVHTAQRAFLQLWRGLQPSVTPLAEFADLASVAEWAMNGHNEVQDWLNAASPEDLARPLSVPPPPQLRGGNELRNPTVGQTVLQVTTHSAHHRGQIGARLRELGGEPSYTDFIVWVWSGQPPADWSFLSARGQTPK